MSYDLVLSLCSDHGKHLIFLFNVLQASAKKSKDFLPFLQRNRRMPAVVEYVLSGHRYKLFIPKETCSIAFSLSGVRCPGRDEPYSNEAIALMRRKIMQRDVEVIFPRRFIKLRIPHW